MKNDTDQNIFLKLCEHIATYNKLYKGKTYDKILKHTEFGRYSQYKNSAIKRNITFELSKEEFINIISEKCSYCGVHGLTFYKTLGAGGIDRVNSNLGYNLSNCVSCCGMCNKMKLDYTKEKFLQQCVKITDNQKNKFKKNDIDETKNIKHTSNERTKKYIENQKKKIGEEEYKKNNTEYMKKYRESKKKTIINTLSSVHNDISNNINSEDQNANINSPINTENILAANKYAIKPDLPPHFSLYVEKDKWYLSYSKILNKIRHNKKILLETMCIQTELNRLIELLNDKYPELNIQNYTVENPYDFTDKIRLVKPSKFPDLPRCFTVFNFEGKDYIQYNKKIDGKKYCFKRIIKSYDLQQELDNYIIYLNEEYKLGISKQTIVDLKGWKTTNKICDDG
jgi:hypothetical protein